MRKENMDTIDLDGRTFHVEVLYNDYFGAPWEEDGHGPVSNWTRRDKRAGELILSECGGARCYYDFAEAIKIAKRDGWDAPPYGIGTNGERAVRAVMADFEHLRRWFSNEWKYVTLHVVLFSEDDEVLYDQYIGGVEYDYTSTGYWLDVAKELASEIICEIERQELKTKINSRFTEAMECGL